jgi:hypothetical protein
MAGKYLPLEKYLLALPDSQKEIRLGFDQIEGILKSKLPSSAYGYRSWWDHETEGNHISTRAWANAGWKVDDVDFNGMWVRFVRAV